MNINYMSDTLVSIRDYDFFGQYVKSKNKEYMFAWSPMEPVIFLLKNDALLYKADLDLSKCRAPNGALGGESICRGFVANNGTALVQASWHIFVFDSAAKLLLSSVFSAIINTCGISNCGRYVICETLNTKIINEDTNKLCFGDILNDKEIWSIEKLNSTDNYDIDVDKKIITGFDYQKNVLWQVDWEGKEIIDDNLNWVKKLKEQHPEHAGKLKNCRLGDAVAHHQYAKRMENRGKYVAARHSYLKFVESVKQFNALNDNEYDFLLESANDEYYHFVVDRDPIYKDLLNKILPVIKVNQGVLQKDFYALVPKIDRSDISYVLYFANKNGVIDRTKKGRTYELKCK